ncbi:MAG: N-acetyl-D-Glu racemase DgcA [Pseudomonadota bacterium]
MLNVSARHERWPLAQTFTIARGGRDAADVVVCQVTDGTFTGWGECVPYARYGETVESVLSQIEAAGAKLPKEHPREALQSTMPAGAARFAMDAALWDLEAKQAKQSVWETLGVRTANPLTTAYTISFGPAEKMASDAAKENHRPLLKIKLASPEDLPRLEAVRAAAPNSDLVVDANEGWRLEDFTAIAPALAKAGVKVVEQPLPADADAPLKAGSFPFALCADESVHDRASLVKVIGHYDMINIKLDKTGGLTEALAMKQAAQDAGLKIMVGCMVGTSLAMAPAMALAHDADVVDLDGPLLMKEDRPGGMVFEGSKMHFPKADFWGGA